MSTLRRTEQLAPDGSARALKVALVGSSGGHLAQLLPLEPWWGSAERTWVTFRTLDAEGALADESDVVWAHYPTTRNVPNLLRNTVLAWKVMRSRRPDVVVTTGAAVALPFFVLSRIFRASTVYVEVYDRIEQASLTARLCRPFADLMLVQWEEQRAFFPEAHVIGPLL